MRIIPITRRWFPNPRYEHKKIKFIQLNQISDSQILVIVVLDNNHVNNKFINLAAPIEDNVLAQLNFIINAALNGLDVTEINMAIMQRSKKKPVNTVNLLRAY